MHCFWKPYTSEVTQFLAELKAQRPTLPAEQQAGRALLWDRDLDREALAEYAAARVPQSPYVYHHPTKPSQG